METVESEAIATSDSHISGVSGGARGRVARNAGIYLVMQLVSWAVAFVGFAIVPRFLGARVFGEIVFVSTTVSTVFVCGTFCIEQFLIREIGRDPEQAERLSRATLGLRIVMFLPLTLICFGVFKTQNLTPTMILYGAIIILGSGISSLSDPLRAILAGQERAFYVSLSDFASNAIGLGTLPFLRFGAIIFPIGSTISIGIVFLLRFYWLRGEFNFRPVFSIRLWWDLIRGGGPFMLNTYIATFYSSSTILILHRLLNDAAVGEYTVAIRLMGAFLFLPSALNAAMLPVLSRLSLTDPVSFKQAQMRVLVTLIICALPVTAGVILLADPLCHILVGAHNYADLPLALRYAALTILPLYIVSTVYQFLVAQGRNASWAIVMVFTVAINAVGAWLIVPIAQHQFHNGLVGAFIATLAAESFGVICAFVLLQSRVFTYEFGTRLLRGGIATAAMAVAIWQLREHIARLPLAHGIVPILTVTVPAICGSFLFAVLVLWLRALPEQEQTMITEMIRRKLRRP